MTLNLNRILICLFFLTAGTLGALLGVARSENTRARKVHSNGAPKSFQAIPGENEDQLLTTSAGVLKSGEQFADIRGENGALIQVGIPRSDASNAKWEAELKTMPVSVLQKAYFDRLKNLEKDSVETRFQRPATPEGEKTQTESLFHAFEAQGASGESYWVAQTHLPISGKDRPVSMLLHFYDALHVSGPLTASNAQTGHDPHEVCWYLETIFTEPAKVEPQVLTGCLPMIARAADKYYITQFINNESVQSFYTYLAVEIPLKAETGAAFELLDAQAQKWKAQGPVSWTHIDSEEAERYQKEFRTLR
ncbi:MAG: hypothetical protein H7222_03165 [Methylotenera sp.]|nr:hypothetical protein [Oligoflexia bacterium]